MYSKEIVLNDKSSQFIFLINLQHRSQSSTLLPKIIMVEIFSVFNIDIKK